MIVLWGVTKSKFYTRISPKQVARHTEKFVFDSSGKRTAKDSEFVRIFEDRAEAVEYARDLIQKQLESVRAGVAMARKNARDFNAAENGR